MRIKVKTKTLFIVGNKKYFSVLGAARHLARIKIMKRLHKYFEEQAKIEAELTAYFNPEKETFEQFIRRRQPSKWRYKQMRERLARTIARVEWVKMTQNFPEVRK